MTALPCRLTMLEQTLNKMTRPVKEVILQNTKPQYKSDVWQTKTLTERKTTGFVINDL